MTDQVYLLRMGKTTYYSVGQVTGDIEAHRKELQKGNPQPLSYVHVVKTDHPVNVRHATCEYLSHSRTSTKTNWFRLGFGHIDNIKDMMDNYVNIAELNDGNIQAD